MSIQGIYDWFLEQVQLLLLMVFVALLIFCAYKRAWIAMVGVVIGIAIIGIFIWNPDMLRKLSEWLGTQFGL